VIPRAARGITRRGRAAGTARERRESGREADASRTSVSARRPISDSHGRTRAGTGARPYKSSSFASSAALVTGALHAKFEQT
jgi:hypothetical protein